MFDVPGDEMASGGDVMLWVMFCRGWGTLGSGIQVDVTLTRSTFLNIVADLYDTGIPFV